MVAIAGELLPADSLVRSVVPEWLVGCGCGSTGCAGAGLSIGRARLILANRMVVVGPAKRRGLGAVGGPVTAGGG